MSAFSYGAGAILDHQLIPSSLWPAQIELIDRRDTFGRFGIEFLGKIPEERVNRARLHWTEDNLGPHGDRHGAAPGAEEALGERLHPFRIVAFAAEDVEIGTIGVIGEVPADQGRFDQLDHRIARHAAFAEMHDLALAESLHPDELAQRDDIGLDLMTVPDGLGITFLEVNCRGEAPRFSLPHEIVRCPIRGRSWGHGW